MASDTVVLPCTRHIRQHWSRILHFNMNHSAVLRLVLNPVQMLTPNASANAALQWLLSAHKQIILSADDIKHGSIHAVASVDIMWCLGCRHMCSIACTIIAVSVVTDSLPAGCDRAGAGLRQELCYSRATGSPGGTVHCPAWRTGCLAHQLAGHR